MAGISFAMLGALVCLGLCGCQSMYYGAMERLGFQKREILVDKVEEARDSQEEAKEEFRSALERFRTVTDFEGGELEEKYDKLSAAYESSKARAADVRNRIDAVKDVADALFAEWEDELDEYSRSSLRRSSEEKLRNTRRRYAELVRAMERAAARMNPVLEAFQDQVLYLKHNLNARAIASLNTEVAAIQSDVDQLIREMEASIQEANRFIASMTAE